MIQKTADFSKTLEAWLKGNRPKTIGGMLTVLEEKSFAFIFLVLMIFPAAPIPTGGITHVFEIIVAIIALQLMIGRTTLWLPDRMSKVAIGRTMQKKVLPFLLKRVEFIQKYSKPRMMNTLQKKWFKAQLGFVVLIFTLAAFLAPPFTGLDTLPSLAVVVIALGIILDDIIVLLLGYAVGLIGVLLTIILGASLVTVFTHFF